MVQAIENLTLLSGTVLARQPHPRLPDYDVVTLRIDRTEPVAGKADLLTTRSGGPIQLSVRRALLGTAAVNARLRCRAKMTPDGAMCEPHPQPTDFEVTGPS